MKRLLLMAFGLALAGQTWADDYDQFLFRQSDGTETAVTAQSLKITFSDGKLVATAAEGTYTWALSDMSTMCFGNADTDTNAITDLTAGELSGTVAVYTVAGAKVAEGSDAQSLVSGLPRGLYIVKNGQTAKKLLVR